MSLIRHLLVAFIWVIVHWIGFSTSALANSPVGWQWLQFEGNQTYSRDDLLDGLTGDLAFLKVARPHVPHHALAETLGQRLRAGYRDGGFVDPDIQIRFLTAESKHSIPTTRVVIREGARIDATDVVVQNVTTIDSDEFIQRIRGPMRPPNARESFRRVDHQIVSVWLDEDGDEIAMDEPAWQEGSPASLDAAWELNRCCRQVLSEMGYTNTLAFSRIQADPTKGTATWHVDLLNAGPMDVVGDVVIVGASVNDRESVCSYLGLKEGMPINAEILSQCRLRLWETERFSDLRIELDVAPSGEARVIITLNEIAGLPPLGEALAPEAIAIKKCRDWMRSNLAENRDLVISMQSDGHRLCLVVGTDTVTASLFEERGGDTESDLEFKSIGALVVQRNRICWFNHPSQEKFEVTEKDLDSWFTDLACQGRFSISLSDEPGRLIGIKFAGHVRTKRDARDPFYSGQMMVPAELFAECLSVDDFKFRYDGGTWVASKGEGSLVIDAQTGAIEELAKKGLKIAFAKGAAATSAEKILAMSAEATNRMDPKRPLSSLASWLVIPSHFEFFADQFDQPNLDFSQTRSRAVAQHLIDAGLLAPLDDWCHSQLDFAPSRVRFSIPPDNRLKVVDDEWTTTAALLALRVAPSIFSEGSWPLTMIRETSLITLDAMDSAKERKASLERIARLAQDPKAGPLRYLMLSPMLGTMKPEYGMATLRLAKWRLSHEAVERELNDIFTDHSTKVAARLRAAWTSLPPEHKACIRDWIGMPLEEANDDVIVHAASHLAERWIARSLR